MALTDKAAKADEESYATMLINGEELLTQAELCYRWGVCLRTVQKERKRWGLEPSKHWIGLMPTFHVADVEAAEELRDTVRRAQLCAA